MMSERMERAEARLKDNVWDIEAWQILVKEYSSKKLEDARSFYERLVTQFPLSGRYWKLYIDQEMKARNYTKVEQLFQRCLMKVLHIELWKCYLNYVKETKATLPTFREKMAQAYDFALEKIDKDLNSYSIWNDYVSFLKNVEAVGSYAENQKITAVRKVYQRGVVNPMMNIDQFWRDYIAYEHSINQMIAEKMVNDRSREYMNARRVAKDYETITRGINRNAPALPPLSRPEDLKQLDLWRKYIAWEKSNPLRTEDTKEMVKRVIFAYEQCLLCMGHYPDIWYEYAAFLNENSQILSDKGDVNGGKLLQDQAAAVYDRAINGLLKTNMLIHFAYADFEEGRNKKEKSREIYERLLEVKEPKFDPTLVYIQFMKFSRRSEGIKAARAVFRRAREDERCEHHIYVCAAMMEFYCTKEKKVACNIFELGLKKYHANANYLAAYIDFLSHLNEENNARVVFEKVLTNDSLKPQDSIQIWNRFLQFESHIGDLSSVIKVEKRRAAVMTKALKVTSETLFVVDRYKFQDLLPCSPTELKSIGYSLKGSGANGLSIASPLSTMGMSVSSPTNTNSNSSSETPTISNRVNPDLDQMIPFKPTMTSVLVPGSHSVPGGIFPPPPAVGQFLAQLPHPSSFHGPFVMIEELMNILRSSKLIDVHSDKLPPTIKPDSGATSGLNSKLFDTAVKASAHFAANFNSNAGDKSNSIKRAIGNEEDDDQDGENSNPANTPTFDIYRSRQLQKRVK